ncbi:MAG: hypothetical protein QM725_03325 [Lacibacter sp.]
MTKSEKSDKALQDKLAKSILPDFINSLHKEGIISESDLSDKKIVFEKLRGYMAKNKGNINWEIFVDHRETLIKVAETEIKKGHFEFAVALYATFIEHTLNRIVHLACSSKKIDNKIQTEIIRSVNIIGKCTWLIKLLDLPTIRQENVKTILSISDERNAYIHYKWKPETDTDKIPDLDKEKKEEDEKIKKIKSLLRYLKTYETKLEYKGKKKHIDKIVR